MTEQTMVLLGDSILDNAPYTTPEPDSTEHLRRLLSEEGWSVHRLALDGAILSGVAEQLERLGGTARGADGGTAPARPDLAVLSIGGNDLTAHIGMLSREVTNSGEVLEEVLALADDFEVRYDAVARAVAERASRTLLCTIYEVPLEPPPFGRLARAPLAILNDRIIRTGIRLGLDVLELRAVCTEPGDFVLQIEPSAAGARKIAEAIAGVVRGDEVVTSARIFGGAQRASSEEGR